MDALGIELPDGWDTDVDERSLIAAILFDHHAPFDRVHLTYGHYPPDGLGHTAGQLVYAANEVGSIEFLFEAWSGERGERGSLYRRWIGAFVVVAFGPGKARLFRADAVTPLA